METNYGLVVSYAESIVVSEAESIFGERSRIHCGHCARKTHTLNPRVVSG